MHVKLVSYSAAVDGLFGENENPDLLEMIAYCARVSNPSNQTPTLVSSRDGQCVYDDRHDKRYCTSDCASSFFLFPRIQPALCYA